MDQADRMTKTIHFEGIAGSGKSTASERLCDILKSKGVDAAWWLEESADHPVTVSYTHLTLPTNREV